MSRESKLDAEIMRLARMLARQHQRKYARVTAGKANVSKFVSRVADRNPHHAAVRAVRGGSLKTEAAQADTKI